jgi:hypothetical protein
LDVGTAVGTDDGAAEGDTVGARVGATVHTLHPVAPSHAHPSLQVQKPLPEHTPFV